MAYLTKRFQKMVRRNGGIPKRGSYTKPRGYDLYHKCGKLGHFIKDCPLLKQDQYKHNTDKAVKRNPVPNKRFKRKDVTDIVVKQALTAWGDSSSESGEDDEQSDTSMMAVESEAAEYDTIFALTAKSDDNEADDDDEVNFLDIQRNLKSYSQKKLISLENILINAYHSLINDKNALTVELGEIEHEIDDLRVGSQKERTPYNPHSKYVSVPDNWPCTHYGNTGYFKENCKARIQSQHKNKIFVEERAMQKNIQKWYMDSGRSKHMTGSIDDFLSFKALQGGSVSFGNGKKGYISGVERIGKTLTHSIENVYYGNGLRYGLLSVSQICDKGNEVEFLSKTHTITNLVTGEVVMLAKRFKNIYVVDFESLHNRDLICPSVVDDDAELWHRRLEHASFSLLNKLVKKDLVHGMPKSRFKDHKVCDACIRGKQVRASFKPKNKFDNAKLDEFCAENGISHIFSAPRTPQQNGIVERKNRTLQDMARTMLIDSGIAKGFWAEAVNTATWKAYKVFNKSSQCVEESIHVIFDEPHHRCRENSHDKIDQDKEKLKVPGEVTDMENGKA
ncbi:uncharacterized protein [Nicotiana tomentosiformis]|uniref:uncharacterized protein n=1 Tax=Nicotiana tomentosiformis TaxID=4098 RepID=UPI00388CA546